MEKDIKRQSPRVEKTSWPRGFLDEGSKEKLGKKDSSEWPHILPENLWVFGW